MDLLSPEPGLIIWSGLTFLIVLYLLTKFAWKPMLSAIKEREDAISDSVVQAKRVQEELKNLEVSRTKLESEMRQERDAIIKEARATQNAIIEKAQQTAREEAEKIMKQTREQIAKEKQDAIAQMKAQVADLSVQIAAQILREELKPNARQEELINTYLKQANFN